MSVAKLIILAAGDARTTWDEAEKSASVTLSDGDLVASFGGGGVDPFVGVRGTNPRGAGKYYAEFAITSGAASNPPMGVGVAEATHDPGDKLGGDVTSCSAWLGSDEVLVNGAAIASLSDASSGDLICMAVDLDSMLIWFRVNGGNWNANAAANPTTGAGGGDISALTAGLYPAASFASSAGGTVTANFGASAFAQSKPAGFVAWH